MTTSSLPHGIIQTNSFWTLGASPSSASRREVARSGPPLSIHRVGYGRRGRGFHHRLRQEGNRCLHGRDIHGSRFGNERFDDTKGPPIRDLLIRSRGPRFESSGSAPCPAICLATSFLSPLPFRRPRSLRGDQAFPERTGGANG